MTVVAVLVDPPREGLVLDALVDGGPLSAAEAAELYSAMATDVFRAVASTGGDLLVNYRPEELLPPEHSASEGTAASAVESLVEGAFGDGTDVRIEPQVGDGRSARVGNTVTHLLESEGAASAAVVPATAPLVDRTLIDGAAMQLRRAPVVLGPAPDGRIAYAGFTEPVDFAGALEDGPLTTLADRAAAADLDVALLELVPRLERPADLATVLPLLRARERAGKRRPDRTVAVLEELDLEAIATAPTDAES